jgi:glutamate mutase epsilon subunit
MIMRKKFYTPKFRVLQSIKLTIIIFICKLLIKIKQGVSSLTVGAQQMGGICKVNKVRLRFNAVSILFCQHFIINI